VPTGVGYMDRDQAVVGFYVDRLLSFATPLVLAALPVLLSCVRLEVVHAVLEFSECNEPPTCFCRVCGEISLLSL